MYNEWMIGLQADAEDVLLNEGGADQQPAHGAHKPLSVALPQAPTEPTADAPTPLSSIGGGASQGQTPVAGAGPTRDTALFYNGLFKSSFSQRGMQGRASEPAIDQFCPDNICDHKMFMSKLFLNGN